MDTNNFRDLLVASHNDKLYVVESPSQNADEVDLVEFKNEVNETVIGRVIDKMFCIKGEEQYRCMSHLHPIFTAEKIYKALWIAESTDNT